MNTSYGFRILGACNEERRLVDHDAAFLGYAACDERAAVDREGYLSAFMFGGDFRDLLNATGSVKGFDGACSSRWVWFDIDRADLAAAILDARRLAAFLVERYHLDDDALLIFFSGSKGFHFGLPVSLWTPEASPTFNRSCRKLAEGLAAAAGVAIDVCVYDKVRAFRAPNSRHAKTGLHKRRLTFDELMGLSIDAVRGLAASPSPFDLPEAPPTQERAVADWRDAVAEVNKQAEGVAAGVGAGAGATLNRSTLAFIREGSATGDRHRLLFSAAANLAEFGCPLSLAHALLTEAGLDSGLSPREVRRQIDCGLQGRA